MITSIPHVWLQVSGGHLFRVVYFSLRKVTHLDVPSVSLSPLLLLNLEQLEDIMCQCRRRNLSRYLALLHLFEDRTRISIRCVTKEDVSDAKQP